MDAISSLAGSLQRAQAMFDNSAARLASSDLPTAIVPDATSPATPNASDSGASGNVDVAGQLTTMMVAADAHHLSAAAMRVALSVYQDSVQLVNTDAST